MEGSPSGRPMTWPVATIPDVLKRLTEPGAPFETTPMEIRGRRVRVYVNAKPDLRFHLDESRRFGESKLKVGDAIMAHCRLLLMTAFMVGARQARAVGSRLVG